MTHSNILEVCHGWQNRTDFDYRTTTRHTSVLDGAFRPLFLLAGLLAIVAVVWWVAGFVHGIATPSLGTGSWWHAHEMIFGFGGAAIGGSC